MSNKFTDYGTFYSSIMKGNTFSDYNCALNITSLH